MLLVVVMRAHGMHRRFGPRLRALHGDEAVGRTDLHPSAGMVPESGSRFWDKTMPEKRTGPKRSGGWREAAILLRDGKALVRGPSAACRVGWTCAAGKSSAAAIADPARLAADRPLEAQGAVL